MRYDYECSICNKEIEHEQKMADPPPECCGQPMKRVIKAAPLTRMAEPRGIIWSDKQIESTHGKRWRETPGSDREGGAGRKLFFDPGARRRG